jgi:hypothetical protein
VILLHSTVSDNSAGAEHQGGGVSLAGPATLMLNHTIIANNQASTGPDIFSSSSVPLIYSLVESTSGFTPTGGPRITGQDPQLGPLADNGGPTQTHALLPGSPAIDAGDLGISSPPAFDQRGAPFARIVDGNEDTFNVIDMGAYEFSPAVQVLVGDYNGNGVVDAADYVIWRKNLGQTGIPPFSGADGDGDGDVTTNDYDVWSANFGDTLPGSGSGSDESQPVAASLGDEPVRDAGDVPQRPGRLVSPIVALDLALSQFASPRNWATGLGLPPGHRNNEDAAARQETSSEQMLLLLAEPHVKPAVSDEFETAAVWEALHAEEESAEVANSGMVSLPRLVVRPMI